MCAQPINQIEEQERERVQKLFAKYKAKLDNLSTEPLRTMVESLLSRREYKGSGTKAFMYARGTLEQNKRDQNDLDDLIDECNSLRDNFIGVATKLMHSFESEVGYDVGGSLMLEEQQKFVDASLEDLVIVLDETKNKGGKITLDKVQELKIRARSVEAQINAFKNSFWGSVVSFFRGKDYTDALEHNLKQSERLYNLTERLIESQKKNPMDEDVYKKLLTDIESGTEALEKESERLWRGDKKEVELSSKVQEALLESGEQPETRSRSDSIQMKM